MSNISTRHNVNPFTAGKSQALNGQRLAKIGYKKTKDQPSPLPSVCVSVPHLTKEQIDGNITALYPHIGEFLAGVQDKVIRSLYESAGGTLKSVSDEEISVVACIAFLEAESTGNRMTAESVGAWFDGVLRDNLSVVIATKLGMEDMNDAQMETINKHLSGYRALFCGLTGKNVFYQPAQVQGLVRALEVCSVDDETSARLAKKLDEMKPVEELLGL
jgi:hypothetical protein